MKKAIIPLIAVLWLLLAGCGELREPVPGWQERIGGSYDDAVQLTCSTGKNTIAQGIAAFCAKTRRSK